MDFYRKTGQMAIANEIGHTHHSVSNILKEMKAAVHLYEKYGFKHLKVEHSDYARCDVQMELEL